MNQLFLVGEMAADFIEALLCYYFIGLFVPEKIKGRFRFLALSLILLCSLKAADHFQVFSLIRTLWFVFYICVTSVLVFQVDTFYAVSLVSFYILCVYIADFFCISVMGVLGKNQQFAQMVISQLSLWRCAYLAANKALLLFFYLLVRKALKKKLRYSAPMIFTVSLLGLCGVGFLSWLTFQETDVHALFSWSMCIVLMFLFYFTLLFYSKYREEQETAFQLNLKEQMVKREYELVLGQQKAQEELSHDWKNHLLVLTSMVEAEKFDEAKAYMKRLGEPLDRLSGQIWTGNATFDLLLNHARNRSRQLGVPFEVRADAVDFSRMEDQDICCLFANLLDNALEAVERMEGENKFIRVKLRKAGGMVFFELENSMGEAPEVIDGILQTTKKEKKLHGLGLKSAKEAAQKYDGILECSMEGNTFHVCVSFLSGI